VLATSAPGLVSVNANLKRPTLAIIDKVNLTHPWAQYGITRMPFSSPFDRPFVCPSIDNSRP
jgi:hypothetical protein